MSYDKTEMNAFVQKLYDQKMQEGKHGHYETMFHVVHKAIEHAAQTTAQAASEIELPEPTVKFDWNSGKFQWVQKYDFHKHNWATFYTADQMREAITQATEAANRRANASWKLMCEKMIAKYAQDAARLDWVQGKLFVNKWNGVVGSGCKTQWSIAGDYRHTVALMQTGDIEIDFRTAIDAAMKGTK